MMIYIICSTWLKTLLVLYHVPKATPLPLYCCCCCPTGPCSHSKFPYSLQQLLLLALMPVISTFNNHQLSSSNVLSKILGIRCLADWVRFPMYDED